jgi:hypothetical protein
MTGFGVGMKGATIYQQMLQVFSLPQGCDPLIFKMKTKAAI